MRLVLAEDHALLRAGLTQILSARGFTVVAAVEDAASLERALEDSDVDAAVMSRRSTEPLERLTPREREVLALMAEGRSNAAVAAVW